MIAAVQAQPEAFIRALTEKTGCIGYFFSPTPYAINQSLFGRLNEAVPVLLDLLDQPGYYNHCIAQRHWNLAVQPMQETDFTGCADFLLTDYGAKLIEMNINLPGKSGLMQTLSAAAVAYLGDPEGEWTNSQYMQQLVQTIRKAIPTNGKIALVVSHLPASKKHQPHYRYFAQQLQQHGLDVTVVQANELIPSSTGCTAYGMQFDRMINLVIPFVWETNPDSFVHWTQVWEQHPERIFPNPTGGMYGTKDLLSYLDSQRHTPDSGKWSDFVLRAYMLRDFSSPEELLTTLSPEQMVLKPLKDYDTKGVYVQPDTATIERIFRENQAGYMAQEFTDSIRVPVQLPNGETAETHSVIYRIYFARKQPIGYQAYYVLNAFNGDYYTAPVLITE